MTATEKKNPTIIVAEPGKLEVTMTREFEAPREVVFRAYTDPAMVIKWLGPRYLKMRIDIYDAKAGGRWRYIHIDPEGAEYAFHGVFHEVTAPERIIQTFEFEGLPEAGHVTLETARFEALPGNRTRLHSQSVFQSLEDRDGMVESGMETGIIEGNERLDELLATLV